MSNSIIDTAALANLKEVIGGDIEDLQELVDDFVTGMPDQLGKMQSQVANSDWSGLRITSHSCKSNARDLGATDLAALCAELELQCKSGEPTNATDQMNAISVAVEGAIAALRTTDLVNV